MAHCHWFVLILNLFVFLGILGLLRFSEFLEREIFFGNLKNKNKCFCLFGTMLVITAISINMERCK